MRKSRRPSITSRSRRTYYPELLSESGPLTSDAVTRKRWSRSNAVVHITAELERVTIWPTKTLESDLIRKVLDCAPVPMFCSKAADDGSIGRVDKLVECWCELLLLWLGGLGEGKACDTFT